MKRKIMHKMVSYLYFYFLLSVIQINGFSVDEYLKFKENNKNLSGSSLIKSGTPDHKYLSYVDPVGLNNFEYFDSVKIKYELTSDEIDLLKKHHFVVSERLNFDCFGRALHDIYAKDLPVMVTTDAILHALHMSYDRILMEIEIEILMPKLRVLLNTCDSLLPTYIEKYKGNLHLLDPLKDVDLYITVARSLLDSTVYQPHIVDNAVLYQVMDMIRTEKLQYYPLFCEKTMRCLDFSQFTVRGHYDYVYYSNNYYTKTSLGNYFKAMMWIGRIDFLMTQPPINKPEQNYSREEIRRMCCGALILNELLLNPEIKKVLEEINEIIDFLVGESDNLTSAELKGITDDLSIKNAGDLFDDKAFDALQKALKSRAEAQQKILSSCFKHSEDNGIGSTDKPSIPPVSFRLSGQRFIVDSYIFSNVVFDRISYQGKKVWRPMPNPLDAMYVLGNNDALPLLKQELSKYHYAPNLSSLRYLIDAYDKEFWSSSLYNCWLQAIRLLSSKPESVYLPDFMKTTAWQQEKLTTQLASWTQLRHDNLLYAKQSYGWMTSCFFPHSYVEPYPEFYRAIGIFAQNAMSRFGMLKVSNYLLHLKGVMDTLEILSEKELEGKPFDENEKLWLKRMLFKEAHSGAPPFDGWYARLFLNVNDAAKNDYVIADLHTQPTDEKGAEVGRVLHAGVGKVNLGIFCISSHSDKNKYQRIYVGPVFSYYEQITNDWKRLTDNQWSDFVKNGQVPKRPDWSNIYLISDKGNRFTRGRTLDEYTLGSNTSRSAFFVHNQKNPVFNIDSRGNITCITSKPAFINFTMYDIRGRTLYKKVLHSNPSSSKKLILGSHNRAPQMLLYRLQHRKGESLIKLPIAR